MLYVRQRATPVEDWGGGPTEEDERANAKVQLDKMRFGVPCSVVWQDGQEVVFGTLGTVVASVCFGDTHVDGVDGEGDELGC